MQFAKAKQAFTVGLIDVQDIQIEYVPCERDEGALTQDMDEFKNGESVVANAGSASRTAEVSM